MATKLIIDDNTVYEIDEDCLERQKHRNGNRETRMGKSFWNMESREGKQSAKDSDI